jgi:hypothetical protein
VNFALLGKWRWRILLRDKVSGDAFSWLDTGHCILHLILGVGLKALGELLLGGEMSPFLVALGFYLV